MKYEYVEVNSERWFDLTPLLNEEFRDIKGYENYQISNYGRVKSLKRIIYGGNKYNNNKKPHFKSAGDFKWEYAKEDD